MLEYALGIELNVEKHAHFELASKPGVLV